jgi:hypothetical protein
MTSAHAPSEIGCRIMLATAPLRPASFGSISLISAQAQTDSLPSWNENASKLPIFEFVARVTRQRGSDFVSPAGRTAMIERCGISWVGHSISTEMAFALERECSGTPGSGMKVHAALQIDCALRGSDFG